MKGIFAAVFVFFAGFTASIAEAAVITPATIDVYLAPGQSTTTEIMLTNTQPIYTHYITSILPFTKGNELGVPKFAESSDSVLRSQFILVERMTLQPGEKKSVPLTITVPQQAEADYQVGVFFEEQTKEEGIGVDVRQRIGALVFVHVMSGAPAKNEVLNFSVDEKISGYLANGFTYEIVSQSGKTLKPEGEIVITSMFGNEMRVKANPLDMRQLSDEKRLFVSGFGDRTVKTGIVHRLKREWSSWGFGRYTATLTVKDAIQTPSVIFYVFPGYTVLLSLIIVGCLIALLRVSRWVNRAV